MVANLHFQFSSENQIILLYLPPVRYHSFFTNLPPISIQPPRVMRGMIACIPLYVNLTSTQGCIRGLAHACVCVCVCMEESKEELKGMSEGECAPDEGFDDGEREVGRILNPSF